MQKFVYTYLIAEWKWNLSSPTMSSLSWIVVVLNIDVYFLNSCKYIVENFIPDPIAIATNLQKLNNLIALMIDLSMFAIS